jgi:uncharacterized Zn finger protein (UPF0148 family)
MEILHLLAKYTYLFIGIVFLPLVVYFAYRTLSGLKRGARTKKVENRTITLEYSGETLKPLNCKNCGGVIASSGDVIKCTHCGTKNELPEHYKTVMQSRAGYERLVQKALKYQKQYEVLTNPVFSKVLLVLALWIILCLFILAFGPTTVREYCFGFIKNRTLLDMLPAMFTVFSLITAGVCLLLRINFGVKTISLIPIRSFDRLVLSREEEVSCNSCGAPVLFRAHEAGHICQYCGVESYRVNFVFKTSQKAKEIAREGNISLVNAMKEVQKAVDDNMAIVGILSIGATLLTIAFLVYYFLDNIA